ncbi:MAG: hypothetical protein ABL884_03440 [Methyloglobulus sp.]
MSHSRTYGNMTLHVNNPPNMEENRFFTTIKKINSVLILLILLGFFLFLIKCSSNSSDRDEQRTVKVTNTKGDKYQVELILSNLQPVIGTDSFYVQLVEKNGSVSYSSGGRNGKIRNVLFFKDKEFTPQWLFDINYYLIERMLPISSREKNKTEAFLYEAVFNDNNLDKSIDRKDKITIAMSKPDGSNFVRLVETVDNFFSHQTTSDNKELVLLYQKHNQVMIEKISLSDFKSINKRVLTDLKK